MATNGCTSSRGDCASSSATRTSSFSRGEAAEFDTRIPHSLSAHGSRPAEVLSIFNDAGMRIHTHTAPK